MTTRSLCRTLLALAALLLAVPARAGGASVIVYPPDGARPRAELDDVAGMIHGALLRAAARGSLWFPSGEKTTARCGAAATAATSCLARMAGDGLALVAVVGRGDRTGLDLRAVDGRGRTVGPVRVAIDFVIQNIEGITGAILRLEELAGAPAPVAPAQAAAPSPADATPAPAPAPSAPSAGAPSSPQPAPAAPAAPAAAPRAAAPPRGPAPREPFASDPHGSDPDASDRRAFGFLLRMGVDFGGDVIIPVSWENGDTSEIKAGQLISFVAGLLYHPSSAWALETTLGYKFDKVNGANGTIEFTRIPFDAIVSFAPGRHRLGAGATIHLSPTFRCEAAGVCDGTVKFDTAFGGIAQWAYGIPLGNRGLDLGARYTYVRYSGTGLAKLDGSGFGFFFGGWI